jgi:outer membrane protein assembly factor BamB
MTHFKKFTFVASIIVVFCSVSSAAEVPDLGTRLAGTDWPAFLGPTADGKSSETGLNLNWKAKQPKLLWQRPLTESYGMPSISRGRLVLYDRVKDKARVVCLNSETGGELWSVEHPTDYTDTIGYDNGPRCAPTIDGERVYTFSAEGLLMCLSIMDGKILWQLDTTKEYNVRQNFFGVGSCPVVAGELLLVHIGGSPADSRPSAPDRLDEVKGNGTCVVAFDKRTGKEQYRTGNDLASYATPVLSTINGKRWAFVFAREGLFAFDPANGKREFEFPFRAKELYSVNASNPVVVNDEVLISECYGPGSVLLKVKPGGYDIVWQDDPGLRAKKALQTHWNTPIYHDGYVYGSSGRNSNNAELRCVEWKTGKVVWSQPNLSRCSLTYVEGHFICLGEYGETQVIKASPQKFESVATLAQLEPTTGERMIDYPAWAAPVISHGLLYVRGKSRLLCYELSK